MRLMLPHSRLGAPELLYIWDVHQSNMLLRQQRSSSKIAGCDFCRFNMHLYGKTIKKRFCLFLFQINISKWKKMGKLPHFDVILTRDKLQNRQETYLYLFTILTLLYCRYTFIIRKNTHFHLHLFWSQKLKLE